MSNIHVLFLLLSIINLVVSNGNIEDRIFGGYDCDMTAYPFITEIVCRIMCGGALLTTEWILTAAHCLENTYLIFFDTVVKAGFNCPPQYSQFRKLKQAIQHPKFENDQLNAKAELRYDIGLVLVQKPFYLTDFVKPCKSPPRVSPKTCKVVASAGIGKTFPSEHLKPEDVIKRPLKCLEFTMVDLKNCSETYKDMIIDDSLICMMDEGKDTCQGDSGGPLICDNNLLIGVVSFGPVDCGKGLGAGSYTKVASYLDFIYKHINNYSYPHSSKSSTSVSDPRSSKSYNRRPSLKGVVLIVTVSAIFG